MRSDLNLITISTENLNPTSTLDVSKEEENGLYIDFSEVRGQDLIRRMKRNIEIGKTGESCQLFTGHIGCGKSTELLKLKKELSDSGFHVVYFEGNQEFDTIDVDIPDILLAIARKVSESLKDAEINLRPTDFQTLLEEFAVLANKNITGANINIPGIGKIGVKNEEEKFSLSAGIAEVTLKAKESKKLRDLMREYMEPEVSKILNAINGELLEPAKQQLKERNKKGLVVIVDNLDRIDNKPKTNEYTQPEYLFITRGDKLNALKCHVVYTMPLTLAFSSHQEDIKQRFSNGFKVLPMVQVKERDGNLCQEGINLLRQMILVRMFPGLKKDQLNKSEKQQKFIEQLFKESEICDYLCQMSGGHVRKLLTLLNECFSIDDPPFSKELINQVIYEECQRLRQSIELDEWELLKTVIRNKEINDSKKNYQPLLRRLYIYTYTNKNGDIWYDINPILLRSKELQDIKTGI
jgi:hypothetical protein